MIVLRSLTNISIEHFPEREMDALVFPLHLFFMVIYSQMMWADCVQRENMGNLQADTTLSSLRYSKRSKERRGK